MQVNPDIKLIPIKDGGITSLEFEGLKEIFFCFRRGNKQLDAVAGCRGMLMEFAFECIENYKNKLVDEDLLIDFSKLELCLMFRKSEYSDNYILKIQDFINNFEDYMNIPRSTFVKVKQMRSISVVFVEANKIWINNPFALSFYLFLMRAIAREHKIGDRFNKTIKKYHKKAFELDEENAERDKYDDIIEEYYCQYSDASDFIESWEFIQKVIRYGIEAFFSEDIFVNFPDEIDSHDFGMAAIATRGDHGDFYENNDKGVKVIYNFAHRKEKDVKSWMRKNKKKMNKKIALG